MFIFVNDKYYFRIVLILIEEKGRSFILHLAGFYLYVA